MEIKIYEGNLELIVIKNLIAANLDEQIKKAKAGLNENKEIENVLLNLESVSEIDSLGINLIVGLYKQVSGEGKTFSVINASKPIKNLFNLFKLSSYFEVS
ncbi:MAG: hypothetical protein CSB55_02280 [Candidatus Cloacimonadota bacterium]|nr:MAG: hypothetical protein CSB55_02280 [Candidatus Cloacimonadota bacterium]